MNEPRILFVYGTLRRDPAHELFHLLARHGHFLGDARVRGRLFDLGSYPGMALEHDSGHVSGELYEITSNWPSVIARLDEYEGCAIDDPDPHEYRRELVEAVRPTGETVTAWAYVLNRDPGGLPVIESGDYLSWRDHLNEVLHEGERGLS
jgi:gamma-glutamylcyclotransferase (GGCT)/AIG2-like uncharacterized protein YtfP